MVLSPTQTVERTGVAVVSEPCPPLLPKLHAVLDRLSEKAGKAPSSNRKADQQDVKKEGGKWLWSLAKSVKKLQGTVREAHGMLGDQDWEMPDIVTECDVEARPGYQTRKAHE